MCTCWVGDIILTNAPLLMSTSQGLFFFSITLMLVVHYGIWSHNGQGIPTVKEPKEQHSEINSYIGYGNYIAVANFIIIIIFKSLQCINFSSFCKFRKSFERQHFRSTQENQYQPSADPALLLSAHPGWPFRSPVILGSNASFCTRHQSLLWAVTLLRL